MTSSLSLCHLHKRSGGTIGIEDRCRELIVVNHLVDRSGLGPSLCIVGKNFDIAEDDRFKVRMIIG